MTTPAAYAEGLRVLWLLFSRGVSATWDGTAVVIAPPDPTADGAIEALEAVLRPDAAGRSYLQQARERHALFLREVDDAKPTDVTNNQWRKAVEGLESFLLSGWGDEALRLGWSRDELFRVPELWSQINICGCALLIADHQVVGVTAIRIGVKTASGAEQGFYRKPQIDYALVFRERFRLLVANLGHDEGRLRAIEFAINTYRQNNNNCGLEDAKAAVLSAIKGA